MTDRAGDDAKGPVMERALLAKAPDGEIWPLMLRVYAPVASGIAEWEATVEVGGLLPHPVRVCGIDSWQSLQLAIQLAADQLAAFEARGGILMWPGHAADAQANILHTAELLPRCSW